MRQSYKTVLLWVVLIVMFVVFYQLFAQHGREQQELAFSDFITKVENGEIRTVNVKDLNYTGTLKDGKIACRTCHTAHGTEGSGTLASVFFLRAPSEAGQLCMMCHTACPAHAIRDGQEGLSFNYRPCIRCFCCQEVCPVGAIDVVEGWLLKYLG